MEGKNIAFEQFLTTTSVQIPLISFSINLILAGLLAWILSLVYIRYGNSISNRKIFAKNIILLAVTTMVIITIVKSSLALSLGLVGALSIVRFRNAIKEPEELAYLFMSITIGLGLGADQVATILVAFSIIIGFIILRGMNKSTSSNNTSLFLTITSHTKEGIDIANSSELLSKFCIGVKLKRYDVFENSLEAVFQVSIQDIDNIKKIEKALHDIDNKIEFSLIDEEGIVV